jgi:predicted unusual protein kinase regulating ubiquinone biosynthesis (AarF/ABC1/UbiB family)
MRTGAAMLRSRGAEVDAEKTAAVLGQLRGVAAKLGQMAAYVDGVVPPQHREAYERAMGKLMSAAPTSDPAEVRKVLEEGLGGSRDDLFAQWNDVPVASASLGQVHRARLPDGTEVAVKVQHPGIAKAMEADLKNTGFMQTAAGWMGGAKFGTDQIFEELRTRFREELDYRLEAERQQRFRRFHMDDDRVHVPAVHSSHSSLRVLTMDFVEGEDFSQACQAPAENRRLWAETMYRFVYGSLLLDGMFNADPHPGNYFFHPDGHVTFLDFGCVQPATELQFEHAPALHRAAMDNDRAAFKMALRATLGTESGTYEDMTGDYVWEFLRPIREPSFTVDQAFTLGLVDRFKQMSSTFQKLDVKDLPTAIPEGMLFMNRLQFGFYSILSRLDVEVDYRSLKRSIVLRAP